jgi:lysozyme
MKPASSYRMTHAARDTSQEFEGLMLVAYPDPLSGDEPWGIGYGHTNDVCEGDTCTKMNAERWFNADVAYFEEVIRQEVTAPISQGIFDAMVDIVYNVGPGSSSKDGIIRLKNGEPSTLLKKLNLGDYNGARAEYPKWVSPGSDVEEGLTRRREAFLVFWDKPDTHAPDSNEY